MTHVEIPLLYPLDDYIALKERVLDILDPPNKKKLLTSPKYHEIIGYYLWNEWNTEQDEEIKLKKRDDLLLYLMPMIIGIMKHKMRFLDENMQIEDLFNMCIIKLISVMKLYNRNHSTGRITPTFTFFTFYLDHFITTETTKNRDYTKKTFEIKEKFVGDGTDAQIVFTEYMDTIRALIQAKNIRKSHQKIYQSLLNILENEDEQGSLIASQSTIITILRSKLDEHIKEKTVETALKILNEIFGKLQITNVKNKIFVRDNDV